MPVRLLGCALLLGISVIYIQRYRRRMMMTHRYLAAWVELLNYTKQEIACFGTPLGRILDKIPTRLARVVMGEQGEGFRTFAHLCRAGARVMHDAGAYKSGELLEGLSREIGTSWREQQLERLQYYLTELERQRVAYEAHMQKQLRLNSALSLCCASGVMLLLW